MAMSARRALRLHERLAGSSLGWSRPVLGGLRGPHARSRRGSLERPRGNFLTGCFLLPESHSGEQRRPLRREALNPSLLRSEIRA